MRLNNNAYELYYEYPSSGDYKLKLLTVKNIDGGTDVIIDAGESVVLWNRRDDKTDHATEEDFRSNWLISNDVKIFLVSGQSGFAADDRGFTIKEKTSGEIVSHYRYTTGVDTSDGLAVQLAIPDFGSEMMACQQNTFGSPGTLYSEQLDNYSSSAPSGLTPDGLFITEIRPNDISRGSSYGDSGSSDYMECVEIFNTGDSDIDFNAEYEFAYLYKSNYISQVVTTIENAANGNTGDTSGVIIPAHGSAIIWCYRAEGLEGNYTSFPTEADFRAAYDIPDSIPVYAQTGQNGWGNTNRGIALLKMEDDGGLTNVSYYFWNGVTDLKDNKSVDLMVDGDGPKMSVYKATSTTNMGTVAENQYTFRTDDGSYPTFTLLDDSETIKQGEFLRIPYQFTGSDVLPVNSINLYYKTNGQESYTVVSTSSFAIYNKYYVFINNAELLNAEYVDYYLKALNDYRTTITDVRRITIVKDEDYNGLRVNFNNSEAVNDTILSGTVNVSAKDFSDPGTDITFSLNGNTVTGSKSIERYAYFTFDYSGVDAYFKNGLTTGDEVIAIFAKCSEIPTADSMAIPVSQSYFTYNEDGTASIELSLRTGTWGSTWEADTDENNDDFTAGNFQLRLTDGTTILPDTTVDMDGTSVDPTATIKMGDSASCTTSVTMTFTIPADKIDASAFVLDTTGLPDGSHTLSVVSGSEQKDIDFSVQNTATEEPEARTIDLNVEMRVNNKASVASVATGNDVSTVTIYKAQSLQHVSTNQGAGDSTAFVSKHPGRKIAISKNGEYPYQILEIPVKNSDINALRIEIEAEASYSQAVQLYILNPGDDTWDIIDTVSGNKGGVTGICQLDGHVADGIAKVLVQARGREYTPYPEPDEFTSVKNSYEWDGTDIPYQYDFAIAWITDTQYYTEQYMSNFTSITDWIVDNADTVGIEYVIHTGDIVDEFNEEYQYINASDELEKFEYAGIPYGVLAGNHDVAHGNMRYDLYWKYFGADRFSDSPVYGGSYKNNLGHYDLITVNGEKLLFLYMSWDIYYPETDWMNDVLAQYPDRKAIICVHGGINASGTQSYTSNFILENVCKYNSNVFAIINGHYHGSSLNIVGFDDDDDGVDDRTVYQICTDYQSAPEGGSGYIKMIYFDLANDKIYLNSYSPVLDDCNYFDTQKLDSYAIGTIEADIDIAELSVDFDRDTIKALSVFSTSVSGLTSVKLGSADRSGSTTSVHIDAKAKDRVGSAYAVLQDSDGNILGYSDTVRLHGKTNWQYGRKP